MSKRNVRLRAIAAIFVALLLLDHSSEARGLRGIADDLVQSKVLFGGRSNAAASGGYNASVEFTPGPRGSIIWWFHGSSIAGCGDLYFTVTTTEPCPDPDDSGFAPVALTARVFSTDSRFTALSSVETCRTFARLDVDEFPMLIKGGSSENGRGLGPLIIPPGSYFHMECFAGNSVMLFTIEATDL